MRKSSKLFPIAVVVMVMVLLVTAFNLDGKFEGSTTTEKNSVVADENSGNIKESKNIVSVPKTKNVFIQAKIVSVIDGDTYWVLKSNSNLRTKVRLIGVDTPESVHRDKTKNTEQGKIVSNYSKEQLKANQIIYLQYDAEATDKYGRDLAYVWLKNDVDTENYKDICDYMYNAKLLKNGYARSMFIKPNTLNKVVFEKIEIEAQKKQKGLWTDKDQEILKW